MKRRKFVLQATLYCVGLAWAVMALSPAPAQAGDATNQFLFLTLRLKDGVVTLKKAEVVPGRLKPQTDSTEDSPLLIALEQAGGEARWTLAIDDPSVQRHEYEDPQQRGVLKAKLVHVDDVEFVVRAPIITGVRYIAVYRKEKSNQPATPDTPPKIRKPLARIELPGTVTP